MCAPTALLLVLEEPEYPPLPAPQQGPTICSIRKATPKARSRISAARYLRLLEIDSDCVGRRAIRRQGEWRGIVDRLKRQLVEPGIAARPLDMHIAKCSARANLKRYRCAAALDSFGFVAR